jgi:hypothetical protein
MDSKRSRGFVQICLSEGDVSIHGRRGLDYGQASAPAKAARILRMSSRSTAPLPQSEPCAQAQDVTVNSSFACAKGSVSPSVASSLSLRARVHPRKRGQYLQNVVQVHHAVAAIRALCASTGRDALIADCSRRFILCPPRRICDLRSGLGLLPAFRFLLAVGFLPARAGDGTFGSHGCGQ